MGDERAFDAAEHYLCDRSESSMEKWRTASLVTAVVGILSRQPQFEHDSSHGRAAAFHAAADELTRRGLDAVALVRYGMAMQVTGMILNSLVQSTGANADRPGGIAREDADAWWSVLSLGDRPSLADTPSPAEVLDLVRKTLAPGIPRLRSWLITASLDDILELRPPAEPILESAKIDILRGLDEQYIWAIDHFSKTFYDDWRTSSLHNARRWIDGHQLPPCSEDLMAERVIEKLRLDAEIAKRASAPRRKSPRVAAITHVLEGQMIRYAASLLAEQRYRDAAAVFEFAASQEPYNGTVRNNLGFCLIPENPLEALGHLEAAAELTDSIVAINTYNRMCCHMALRRSRDALNLADKNWPEVRSKRTSSGATLWRRGADSESWVIFHADDERLALAELATAAARDEGQSESEQAWRVRVTELAS